MGKTQATNLQHLRVQTQRLVEVTVKNGDEQPQGYGFSMPNGFSDRPRPECDDRNAAPRLVLVIVHDNLHGIGAGELLTDLHHIVFAPCLARSMKRPHRKRGYLRVTQRSIEDVPLRDNPVHGDVDRTSGAKPPGGRGDLGMIKVEHEIANLPATADKIIPIGVGVCPGIVERQAFPVAKEKGLNVSRGK